MKHLLLLFAFLSAAYGLQAGPLHLTVTGIRSDKGNILVMARAEGREEPLYALVPAARGSVEVLLEGIDSGTVEIRLFHDEDGDNRLKMGQRGPEEGYATKRSKLGSDHNAVRLSLYYPLPE